MFKRLVPLTIFGLVVSETLLIFGSYLLSLYLMLEIDPIVWLAYESGAPRLAIVSGFIVFGLYMLDMYADPAVPSNTILLQQVSLVIGLAFLFQATLSYVVPALVLPRWVMMTGSLTCLAVLPAWRIAYWSAVSQGMAAEPVLFLGDNCLAVAVAREMKKRPELAMLPLGFLSDSMPAGNPEHLGPISDLRFVVGRFGPRRIVVGLQERRRQLPVYDLLEMKLSGIAVEDAASAYETVFGRISLEQLRPSQLIFSRELGPTPITIRLQSIYSFGIALAAFILVLPVLAAVWILIRLTSRGPALYKQRRVGRLGVPFNLYKFRSMRVNAEAGTGAVWAQKDDPRVTPVGWWLRRLRLDELPQLVNVLRGEMSLVGPRPERPEFVSALSSQIPFYPQRHFIKPGITGWAQINHKYGDTMEDTVRKLEYDLYYIKHLSPALDFYIMFHTVKVMLLSRGSQ